MPEKPTKLPRWATDPDTTVEPNEGKKDAGFVRSERPPARFFNWFFNLVYQWIQYLNDPVGTGSGPGMKATGGSGSGVGLHGVGGGTGGDGVRGEAAGLGIGVRGVSPSGWGGQFNGAGGVVGTGSIGVGVRGVGGPNQPGVEGRGDAEGEEGGPGGIFTGTKNHPGIQCEGGPTGPGGRFTGNATNAGVIATGGGSGGIGVAGTGSGAGVSGTATGSGPGVIGDSEGSEGVGVLGRGWAAGVMGEGKSPQVLTEPGGAGGHFDGGRGAAGLRAIGGDGSTLFDAGPGIIAEGGDGEGGSQGAPGVIATGGEGASGVIGTATGGINIAGVEGRGHEDDGVGVLGIGGGSAGIGVGGISDGGFGVGVQGRALAGGTGVRGISSGGGNAMEADASGGTGRALILSGNDTRAPLAFVPRSGEPSLGSKGEAYFDNDGRLYVHDGTAFRALAFLSDIPTP